jgi:hypothetical protein
MLDGICPDCGLLVEQCELATKHPGSCWRWNERNDETQFLDRIALKLEKAVDRSLDGAE